MLNIGREMKWMVFYATFMHIYTKLGQENPLWMVRWMRWHCPPDTGFEIWALAVWGRTHYFLVTETHFVYLKLEAQSVIRTRDLWMTFQTGSFNHCTRAPAPLAKCVGVTASIYNAVDVFGLLWTGFVCTFFNISFYSKSYMFMYMYYNQPSMNTSQYVKNDIHPLILGLGNQSQWDSTIHCIT